jgi:hypothetical protein
MCTSFVIYAEKTYAGMNFDISDRPIKLCSTANGEFLVVQKDGSGFHPAFGCHRRGTFINMMMVDPIAAGEYRRGKDVVHIQRLFADVLSGRLDADALDALLRKKAVVNVPDYSVHSMIAMEQHRAWAVEPGRGTVRLDPAERNFLALACFPLSDFAGKDYTQVAGAGADRYMTVYGMLSEDRRPFTLDRGFEILRAVAQDKGEYPTQFSMISVMEEDAVYFSLKRNFSARFKFTFADRTVRTDAGFAGARECALDPKGVSLLELTGWR